MADSVANVYSTALFDLCCEQNCLENVYEELVSINDILRSDENSDFFQLMNVQQISAAEKNKALSEVFNGKISPLVMDFLCLLNEKGRFKFLPEITKAFTDKYNVKMNILEVTAITSTGLSAVLRDKLIKKLSAVSGKTIRLTEKVDKAVIGGIVLRYGNTELDSSVKTALDKLRSQINGVIA